MQLTALQVLGTLDNVQTAKSPQLMRGPLGRQTMTVPNAIQLAVRSFWELLLRKGVGRRAGGAL